MLSISGTFLEYLAGGRSQILVRFCVFPWHQFGVATGLGLFWGRCGPRHFLRIFGRGRRAGFWFDSCVPGSLPGRSGPNLHLNEVTARLQKSRPALSICFCISSATFWVTLVSRLCQGAFHHACQRWLPSSLAQSKTCGSSVCRTRHVKNLARIKAARSAARRF